jgi:predicted SprT family Zn-dependent metalloprotease
MEPSDVLAFALEEQVRARAIVSGLGPCPIVLSRARTELGSFSVDANDAGRRRGGMEIRISRYINEPDQVRETARHELAHQAAWERYRYVGHGALWQTFASYLDCEPVACAGYVLDGHAPDGRPRYEIACNRCGWTTVRERRSKLVTKPWRFACARCGGSLHVVVLTEEPATGF